MNVWRLHEMGLNNKNHASYRMREKITLIPSTKQILGWNGRNQTKPSFPLTDLLYRGNQRYFSPHSIRSVFYLDLQSLGSIPFYFLKRWGQSIGYTLSYEVPGLNSWALGPQIFGASKSIHELMQKSKKKNKKKYEADSKSLTPYHNLVFHV